MLVAVPSSKSSSVGVAEEAVEVADSTALLRIDSTLLMIEVAGVVVVSWP